MFLFLPLLYGILLQKEIEMKKKLFLLTLALCLCLSLLIGCGPDKQGDNTTTSADPDTTTSQPVVDAPTTVELVKDGVAQYKIIRDDDLASSSTEVVVARTIIDRVKQYTGATMTLGTDWVKRDAELDSSTYEILVGSTNYKESREVYSTLGYGEVAVKVVGNKIVIAAYTDSGLSYAVSCFNRALAKGVSEDGKSLTVDIASIEMKEVNDAQLNIIPHYDDGQFVAYYDAGNDCYEMIFNNTSVQGYQAYLEKLPAAGYTKYTDHQMGDNLFATYNSDKYTLTVGYYDYETAVRVLFEPKADPVGLKEENVYTKVTTPQITMLGLEYKNSQGEATSNGLCMLIRLSDGRFIVVDGGFNRGETATNLLNTMKEQSKEYAKSISDIKVAAWIITHSHGDHNGTLNGQYNTFRGIKVERILVNYMSETERLKAINSVEYGGNWSSGEGSGSPNTYVAAKALGTKVQKVHVGQVFYLADVQLEVLYTLESYAPKTCNALNTSSLIMKLTFDNGTTYLSTGDATGPAFNICNKMYGDYMQCDIVQVAHHGYTTWSNESATAQAYRLINATTVLWPQGLTAYPNYKDKSYNAPLFQTSNYKEVYVAGASGDKIIVPLPLVPGTAIVTRK